MSKKYYVERKADNVWMVAAEDGSDAQEFNDQGRAIRCCIELNAPVQLQAAIDFVLCDASPDETLDDELKFAADRLYNLHIFDRETIAKASHLALYANHITTELQAENAQLRAKVAELEVGVVCEFNRDDVVETCDGLFYVLGAHHGDRQLFVCDISGAVNDGAEFEIRFCDVIGHWPESAKKQNGLAKLEGRCSMNALIEKHCIIIGLAFITLAAIGRMAGAL